MTAAAEWQGRVGDVWAAEWRRTDRSFADLGRQLDAAIRAAAPPGGFRALDVGCGAGQTSLALATARPDALITGVDLSPELIAAATERGAGDVPQLRFVRGDATVLAAGLAPLDLFYSRHGVMFFDDPAAAFAALRAAAAPGAGFVFSCFRSVGENPWASEIGRLAGGDRLSDAAAPPAGPGPFAFADPAQVRRILAAAGWERVELAPLDFTYHAGGGDDPVADAVSFFSRIGPASRALRELAPAGRPAALARIAALCERHLRNGQVDFPGAAWLVSARNPGAAA